MTYNVFSGTLNPTHFTSLHTSKVARVNEEAHSFTCHPHLFMYEMSQPAFIPQLQSITVCWLVLISLPA